MEDNIIRKPRHLTREEALEIRRLYKEERLTIAELSRKFEASYNSVRSVLLGTHRAVKDI